MLLLVDIVVVAGVAAVAAAAVAAPVADAVLVAVDPIGEPLYRSTLCKLMWYPRFRLVQK